MHISWTGAFLCAARARWHTFWTPAIDQWWISQYHVIYVVNLMERWTNYLYRANLILDRLLKSYIVLEEHFWHIQLVYIRRCMRSHQRNSALTLDRAMSVQYHIDIYAQLKIICVYNQFVRGQHFGWIDCQSVKSWVFPELVSDSNNTIKWNNLWIYIDKIHL